MENLVESRASGNAAILLWQSRVRVTVALLAGGVELALQRLGVLGGSTARLAEGVIAYVALVLLCTGIVAMRRRAGAALVTATILADLCFVFGATLVASRPEYYDRILIFSFLVLYVAESYFGRTQALVALGTVIAGYLATVTAMMKRGAPLDPLEELLSVSAFSITAVVFILQYGSFRRRLNRIALLFDRAQQGDFSEEYHADRDRHPDAVTLVGRAYNRVREQLASMVLTDPLTSCLNRRGFDQALAREVSRAARAGSELSLLALDLDHFKEVNDTRGHLVGDRILRELGALLVQAARGGDVVARTGGEEFSILLPDTGGSGAFQFATRLCDTVRLHAFGVNGKAIHLTVSIGVVARIPDRRQEVADELKLQADEALYAAKRGGRDRVRTWGPGMTLRRSTGELTVDRIAEIVRNA